MGQDLRKLFKNDSETDEFTLPKGHLKRFEEKLDVVLPIKKGGKVYVWKIAASFLILASVGLLTYNTLDDTEALKTTVVDVDKSTSENTKISLGNLSPDLKKIEDYYQVNINLELSQLSISDDTKELVNSYMDRLSELHTEYQKLNAELNTIGPNDQLISALINNLQLRLQLLQKLRLKLNELKLTTNETTII
ncbi:hypothetical protein MWU65_16095 [Cellulophaga sp. F20128]|uniref:hypothetical protein n=1 Tax=Cellulophaga sp. F20128 TaxID=2926413 RepID=UPI001FF36393|nr:hypothetical protein [Cellulophaga sp. F20128]MCK0158714.1 hypothetical protein [Cellulophaga sp. F20128]